jgi:diphosphoinositol-polyphosphate diphosphatase
MMASTKATQILPPDQKNGSGEQQEQEPQEQTKEQEQVQVDLSNMIGRIKPKPVCVDAALKQQSMSCEEISKSVFVTTTDGPNTNTNTTSNNKEASLDVAGSQELSVVSSCSSSTASRENGVSLMDNPTMDWFKSNQSDNDSKEAIASSSFADGRFVHRKSESERINLKVKTQTISRNGRQTQRWYTDPVTHTLYRMTTGCIPVLKDGRVLFCSASRKSEWILPKGGWEKDEVMEESAIRETFEEAGVFGIIGPTLSEIEFETRKGKKRRIEFEEVQRKVKLIREAQSSSPNGFPQTEEAMATPISTLSKNGVVSSSVADVVSREKKNEVEKTIQRSHNEDQQQLKTIQHYSDGDNGSVASETSVSHAHVKMSLFPLYVTEVMETWPEQGRFRKVVDIDEAIRISESRPYFQRALKELKERNLHVSQELQPLHKNGTSSTNDTTALVIGKKEQT